MNYTTVGCVRGISSKYEVVSVWIVRDGDTFRLTRLDQPAYTHSIPLGRSLLTEASSFFKLQDAFETPAVMFGSALEKRNIVDLEAKAADMREAAHAAD
jgi:hypothetical protein